MSQAKVDRYKAEKANRKQAMRRQKLIRNLDVLIVTLIIAALVGWIGYSIYQHKMAEQATQKTDINLDAISSYNSDLNADEETDGTGKVTESEDTDSGETESDAAESDASESEKADTEDSNSEE